MNKQSIIIYDFEILFNIFNEIKENLKFEVFNFKKNYNISNLDNNIYGNYLIIFNPLDNSIKNSIKKKQLFLIENLPESPPYFPKDQLTDRPERFFVNEAVRENIFISYSKEIPYSVEVNTEEFFEDKKIIRIRSIINVERESQKGIIIGNKGKALKKVGVNTRKKLEKFFGKKIYIELYVKVSKKWRSNPNQLKRFGYN